MTDKNAEPRASKGRFWAFFPAILLTGLLGTQVAFLAGALDDPSFSVEKDYYQKAVSWDAKMAQDKENARLGWGVSLSAAPASKQSRVTVELSDRRGTPVAGARITVEAFHNARANRVLSSTLTDDGDGRYTTKLALQRAGLWEFRLRAQRGADVFVSTVRKDVLFAEEPAL